MGERCSKREWKMDQKHRKRGSVMKSSDSLHTVNLQTRYMKICRDTTQFQASSLKVTIQHPNVQIHLFWTVWNIYKVLLVFIKHNKGHVQYHTWNNLSQTVTPFIKHALHTSLKDILEGSCSQCAKVLLVFRVVLHRQCLLLYHLFFWVWISFPYF